MLQPLKTKYRKQHRGRGQFKGKASRGAELAFGSYGLKAQSGGEITARQLEAARRAITHAAARGGKIWIRIFPHKPITRKSPEVPMGAGKGSVEFYAAVVKPGTILFEMDGLPEALAKEAFRLAAHKLPVSTKMIVSIHKHAA
ncbi:50S ribosomal protein L16 [Candidatus Peribacteria bacterium RIFCSPLOWO2_01_FULL_51_18]|nr:MAG: 50S ribosomal protein L16 [Candidatus Peribacteria bacterium RIFCSPHIGHO2_02_FULL_51_15]OGJ65605.1 MAG: 50S ribosomal protein L16 [Candidatus Peribacteria bacterium RIFCSPLOWO2_01_FULL_51_18]OGJ69255.1 MAG: 50S ribosomal protein L16 [Candidatus Peribacteria bacterium RIFCSPLOWO2_02_FULL_51_10]